MELSAEFKKRLPLFIGIVVLVLLTTIALWHYSNSSKARLQPTSFEELTSFPEDTDWTDAIQAYENGDYAQAVEGLEVFLSRNPEHTDGLFYMGLSLLETGQESRAADLLDQVRINDPSYYPDATWYLALARVKEGDTQEARMLMTELANGQDEFYREKANVFLDQILQ